MNARSLRPGCSQSTRALSRLRHGLAGGGTDEDAQAAASRLHPQAGTARTMPCVQLPQLAALLGVPAEPRTVARPHKQRC